MQLRAIGKSVEGEVGIVEAIGRVLTGSHFGQQQGVVASVEQQHRRRRTGVQRGDDAVHALHAANAADLAGGQGAQFVQRTAQRPRAKFVRTRAGAGDMPDQRPFRRLAGCHCGAHQQRQRITAAPRVARVALQQILRQLLDRHRASLEKDVTHLPAALQDLRAKLPLRAVLDLADTFAPLAQRQRLGHGLNLEFAGRRCGRRQVAFQSVLERRRAALAHGFFNRIVARESAVTVGGDGQVAHLLPGIGEPDIVHARCAENPPEHDSHRGAQLFQRQRTVGDPAEQFVEMADRFRTMGGRHNHRSLRQHLLTGVEVDDHGLSEIDLPAQLVSHRSNERLAQIIHQALQH